MILCRNLLKNTQFRQSKENHRFMLDFKFCFLEMRRPILLQKVAFLCYCTKICQLLNYYHA